MTRSLLEEGRFGEGLTPTVRRSKEGSGEKGRDRRD